MKYKQALKKNLKMRGLSVNDKIIDFFYDKPKIIGDEDYSMYSLYLIKELKVFSLNYYGKEIDHDKIKESIKQIVKNFSRLSTVEIKYCLQIVVNGEYEWFKKWEFNISDIIKVIRIYDSKKKAVQSSWYNAMNEERQDTEGKQIAFTFLQSALKKHSEKKHLTVYEKSALGKHFVEQMDGSTVESIMSSTVEQLPQYQKEVRVQRATGLNNIVIDPEMLTPILWTKNLLFGVLIYNSIQK